MISVVGDIVDITEYRNRFCNACKYKVPYGCSKGWAFKDFELWYKGKKPTCFEKKL